MKKSISVLALAATLAAGAANAADLPSRKEAPPVFVPPPVFSWTGFYGGLNLGGGWLERRNDWNNWAFAGAFPGFGPVFPGFPAFPAVVGVFPGWGWNNNNSSGGVVGGLQLGYNYQLTPLFVVGLETDFQGTSIGSNNSGVWWWGGGNWFNERVPWFGTVRGRAGIALLNSRLFVYGTGGFAYGEVHRPWGNWWGNNNDISTGWTAGGGLEYAFLPNWSAKVEYLFTELSRSNNNWNWGFGWNWNRRTQFHTVRAGVNYHFNLFTPAPVVARY
jgi:outer membrane immunogenic protein